MSVSAAASRALITEIRKAVRSGRPTPDGLIAAEGPHLLAEALRGRWEIDSVFCTAESRERFSSMLASLHQPTITVAARAFDSLAHTATTQGILTLLRPRIWRWADLLGQPNGPVIVLDAIQDPGNAGTIARSAEAFGAAGLVLVEGSARLANGKFLRAAAGSLFRIPVLDAVPRAALAARLADTSLPCFALAADGASLLAESALSAPSVIFVGNEGAGVSPELRALARTLRIPTAPGVESLNAAVACSLALYEAARQRSAHA